MTASGMSGDRSRFTRRRFVQSSAALVGGASILAACGGDGGGAATGASGGARRGGVMKFAIGSVLVNESLDPQHTLDANEDIFVATMFELLCEMNTSFTAQPRLAESWKPNDALTEWTFVTRTGVNFHDGGPFTAKDAAYTLSRILDPDTGSIHLSAWSHILDPEGITTPDANHLVLKLKKPSALPPVLFAYRGHEIVREGTSAEELARRANGTGPFKYVSFTPAQSWQVERNDAYWKKGKPYLDGIQGVAATDPSAKVQSVLSGDADSTDTIDYSLARTVEGSTVADLVRDRARTEMYAVMDVREHPFDDPRVRMAMKLAMDRKLIAQTAFQGYATLTSDTVEPLGDPFYPPDLGVRARNLDQAKQLLSEAGYPNGIDITLNTANIIGGMVDMNVALAETLDAAGIRMKIQQGAGETYYEQVWRQVPMFVDWIVKRHLAERLPLTFTSDAVWPQSHYPDTPIDQMFEVINLKPDDPQSYVEPLSWISNNEGYLNPAFGDGLLVRKKRVKDLKIRVAGDYLFEDAYLSL
jgi:peptide/nickel transport system substrate-binding protein